MRKVRGSSSFGKEVLLVLRLLSNGNSLPNKNSQAILGVSAPCITTLLPR
jgi:hypothetical protein